MAYNSDNDKDYDHSGLDQAYTDTPTTDNGTRAYQAAQDTNLHGAKDYQNTHIHSDALAGMSDVDKAAILKNEKEAQQQALAQAQKDEDLMDTIDQNEFTAQSPQASANNGDAELLAQINEGDAWDEDSAHIPTDPHTIDARNKKLEDIANTLDGPINREEIYDLAEAEGISPEALEEKLANTDGVEINDTAPEIASAASHYVPTASDQKAQREALAAEHANKMETGRTAEMERQTAAIENNPTLNGPQIG